MSPSRRISVIIPTHSRANLLSVALKSVAAQTLRPLEVVVVSDIDDPAAERACKELEASSGLNVKYVYDESTSGGASASRNIGAQRATGDFYAFLDDDDRWLDEYLASVDACFAVENKEMVVTWRSIVRGDIRVDAPPMKRDLAAKDVAAQSLGTTGSNIVVHSKAFWRCGGFDPQMPVKNDTDFVFRFMLAGGTYGVVERRLVEQIKHEQGQLTNGNARRISGTRYYMQKHAAHLRLKDRRQLMLTVRRMQYHSASNWVQRTGYLILALSNYSPAKYLEERQIRRAWLQLEQL